MTCRDRLSIQLLNILLNLKPAERNVTASVPFIIIFQVFKRVLKSWKVHFWRVRKEKLRYKNVLISFACRYAWNTSTTAGRKLIGFDFGGFTELLNV